MVAQQTRNDDSDAENGERDQLSGHARCPEDQGSTERHEIPGDVRRKEPVQREKAHCIDISAIQGEQQHSDIGADCRCERRADCHPTFSLPLYRYRRVLQRGVALLLPGNAVAQCWVFRDVSFFESHTPCDGLSLALSSPVNAAGTTDAQAAPNATTRPSVGVAAEARGLSDRWPVMTQVRPASSRTVRR